MSKKSAQNFPLNVTSLSHISASCRNTKQDFGNNIFLTSQDSPLGFIELKQLKLHNIFG